MPPGYGNPIHDRQHHRQDPAASIARLLALLDVERIEDDLYRGQSTNAGWMRVYGGQVVAQALMAASRTVDARPALPFAAQLFHPTRRSRPPHRLSRRTRS